jgi:hypothetical protein
MRITTFQISNEHKQIVLKVCLIEIQILAETFRIQVLSRNVPNDESESLHEIIWLIG